MSQAALGRALGISPGAVTKAKQQGMPVSSLAAASAWRREHLDPAHMNPAPGDAVPARHYLRRPVATTPGDAIRMARMKPTTFQRARTDREVYEAKLAQLRYEQESGTLINAAEVRTEFAKAIVVVRDRMLRLPDRLVVMLLGESDARRMRTLIDDEVRAVLAEFHGKDDEKPTR
jgi:hypothetical protein